MRIGCRHIVGLLLALLALEAGGCQNGLQTPKWLSFGHENQSGDLRVEQRVGGQPADLKAGEIVRIMRRIGLPDDQIFSLGSALRDAMRATGTAELMRGAQTEIRLAVNEDHLFVQSRSQGSFVYCLKEQRFVPVPLTSGGNR